MGNMFTARGVEATLRLSNGGTSVLLDVLTLAGSAVAHEPWEQHLVLLFADSERAGYGISGFDLAELPWTDTAATQHGFLVHLLDLATARHGWDRLHYEPMINESLRHYRYIITAFEPSPGPSPELGDWTVPPPAHQTQLCLRHNTFHGEWMCRLCDPWLQPVDAPTVWDLVSTADRGEITDRRIQQIPDKALPALNPLMKLAAQTPGRSATIPGNVIDQLATRYDVELDPAMNHYIRRSIA